MSPELISYLKDNRWRECWGNEWELILNSECYATINIKDGKFIYDIDCPDVRMPAEDYFKPVTFESEKELMEFLEKRS